MGQFFDVRILLIHWSKPKSKMRFSVFWFLFFFGGGVSLHLNNYIIAPRMRSIGNKVWSMLHHGSLGRVQRTLLYLFKYFWGFFFFFIIKLMVSSFSFLSLCWSSKFSQQNIDQSETGIGDKKLSVKLCIEKDGFTIFGFRKEEDGIQRIVYIPQKLSWYLVYSTCDDLLTIVAFPATEI